MLLFVFFVWDFKDYSVVIGDWVGNIREGLGIYKFVFELVV